MYKLEVPLKVKLLIPLLIWLCTGIGITPLMAQSNTSEKVIVLFNDQTTLSIEAFSDRIFRIRMSEKNEFPETLMERYEIINGDLKGAEVNVLSDGDIQTIQSQGIQFLIDKKAKTISVSTAAGEQIIDQLNLDVHPDLEQELIQSVGEYFGTATRRGNIIGDDASDDADENVAGASKNENKAFMFSLKQGERFYGGGATSRKNIQHRGEVLRMWAIYQKTEIPIPFLMSSEGWGIFNNTTSINYFDVGRFKDDKLCILNSERDIDFYLMLGTSMYDVLDKYTTITKKSFIMPRWAYGLAFGGNTMEDQFDVMNDAIHYRKENIPCDVFWLEPQWMETYYDFSTSKNWNLKKFPAEPFWEVDKYPKYEHPLLFVSRLHELGFKLALWLCIDHDLTIQEEDRIAAKLGKDTSGKEHWFDHLTRFIDQGVDGFKLDPGRTLDEHPDREYFNGHTDSEMHNLNQVLLSKQMNQTFRKHKGIRSFHHYCGGYAGSQHWGAATSGDNGGGKDALFDQLNLGLSGYSNTSIDVMDVKDDHIAAMHLGFMLPWVQINSWYTLLHPWYFPPTEKEAFTYYARLRNNLNPYIYSAAIENHLTGKPILRAMPFEFPDDRNVDNMIYQYMFGGNLLVGVFSDSVYLPQGEWINYWNNETINGGKTIHAGFPQNRGGALFVKAGAIIPLREVSQYIGETPLQKVHLMVYPRGKSEYTLYEDDGVSFDYEKGKIASTRFTSHAEKGNLEFVIEASEGDYKGRPLSRKYSIDFFANKKPASVKVNGQDFNDWSFDGSGKLSLEVDRQENERVLILIKN